jgi:hypothetical protein
VHTGGEKKLGWVTGALRGERAGVEFRDQVSSWSQQIVQVLQARSKFGLASYRERKGDPLKAVIEGNLKTPERGYLFGS